MILFPINVDSTHRGVPDVRIFLTSETGNSFTGETDIDGSLRFDEALEPGIYVVDIIETPVGFVHNGFKAHIRITGGETAVACFLLTNKQG